MNRRKIGYQGDPQLGRVIEKVFNHGIRTTPGLGLIDLIFLTDEEAGNRSDLTAHITNMQDPDSRIKSLQRLRTEKPLLPIIVYSSRVDERVGEYIRSQQRMSYVNNDASATVLEILTNTVREYLPKN